METEKVSAMMQRMHDLQVKAEDDRRRAELLYKESKEQQAIILDMSEK